MPTKRNVYKPSNLYHPEDSGDAPARRHYCRFDEDQPNINSRDTLQKSSSTVISQGRSAARKVRDSLHTSCTKLVPAIRMMQGAVTSKYSSSMQQHDVLWLHSTCSQLAVARAPRPKVNRLDLAWTYSGWVWQRRCTAQSSNYPFNSHRWHPQPSVVGRTGHGNLGIWHVPDNARGRMRPLLQTGVIHAVKFYCIATAW